MDLLYKSRREKVFHELPQMFLCDSIMEEGYSAINDPKYRWRAMSSEVVCQPSFIANIYHPYSNT